MEDLKMEVAERYARALKWVEAPGHKYWHTPPEQGLQNYNYSRVPLDLQFWFPRLWNAGLRRLDHESNRTAANTMLFFLGILTSGLEKGFSAEAMCESLCEAIELLETK